jgi:hypothetical protein
MHTATGEHMKEALKLALETLESSDKLINGSGNHFGLEGAMDGYYSGCFDVDGNNKLLNKAITAIKEALAQQQQSWVCLTKEEIDSALSKYQNWYDFSYHLENILKEKNQ